MKKLPFLLMIPLTAGMLLTGCNTEESQDDQNEENQSQLEGSDEDNEGQLNEVPEDPYGEGTEEPDLDEGESEEM